jgi:multidrug efflux pump subunit AcrA (membrane-fusion protein)
LQAVTTVKGRQVCYVQNGDELVPVPVTVGNFNDQFIEIRAGLKDGDLVALTPPTSGGEESEQAGSMLSTEDKRPPPTSATTTAKKTSGDPSSL